MEQSLDKGLGQSSCLFWSGFHEVTTCRTPACRSRACTPHGAGLGVPRPGCVGAAIQARRAALSLGKALPFLPDIFFKRTLQAVRSPSVSLPSESAALGGRCGRGKYCPMPVMTVMKKSRNCATESYGPMDKHPAWRTFGRLPACPGWQGGTKTYVKTVDRFKK